jgi:hypothetical protein
MRLRYVLVAVLLAGLGLAGFVLESPLLGVFEVTPLLNVIHLAAATCAGIAAFRGIGSMRSCGKIIGAGFAGLAIAAFAMDSAAVGDTLPLTDSNAWLHLVLALVFLYHALLAPPVL